MLKAEVSVAAGEALHFADFGYLLGECRENAECSISDLFFLKSGQKKLPADSAVAPQLRSHLSQHQLRTALLTPGRQLHCWQFSSIFFLFAHLIM